MDQAVNRSDYKIKVKAEPRKDSFEVPRYLYYFGCLTLCQLNIRPFTGITLSDIMYLASTISTLILILIGRRLKVPKFPKGVFWGSVIFLLGGCISSLFSSDQYASFVELAKYGYLFLIWFWLGLALLTKEAYVVNAIIFWAVSAAIAGAAAIAQLVIGPDIIPNTEPMWGRMTGTAQHVNDLGGLEAIALYPCIALASQGARGYKWTLFVIILSSLMLAGLFLLAGMGSVIAVAAGGLIYLYNTPLRPKIMLILLIAFLIGCYVITVQEVTQSGFSLVHRIVERLEGTSDHDTLNTRMVTYREGWEGIKDSFIIGHGMTIEDSILKSEMLPHNILLFKWYQAGLLGLIGTIIIILAAVKISMRVGRISGFVQIKQTRVALSASLISFIVFAAGAPISMNRYAWMAIALIIALDGIARDAKISGMSGVGYAVK